VQPTRQCSNQPTRKQQFWTQQGTPVPAVTAEEMLKVEKDSFAKAIVDADSLKILGFHIIGPHAAILIQEVINAMSAGYAANELGYGMHIHPALSELVLNTSGNLSTVD
jgi:pyruvate/2-oxoglutarate dehydrogenase complex dihydrolipoamide dehydrogenase (E3) component